MKESSEPPTLTELPQNFFKRMIKKGVQIIRMIIQTGAKIINMIIKKKSDSGDESGLISPSSCKLPSIYSISIGEINARLGVCIIVEDEHATFVSSLLPASRTVEPVENHLTMLANKTRIKVEFPLNDTASINECLTRLFQNTIQIEFLRIVNFVNLEIIMKAMGRTEIGTIELFQTSRQGRRIMRNTLTEIIERHSIYQVFICENDDKFRETEIEDILLNLPRSVKNFVAFGSDGSLVNFSKDHWKAIAQDLVDNKGMRKVSIFQDSERGDLSKRFCDYRDPIMHFMANFVSYFDCSCIVCQVHHK